jgi:anaerobic selenocysteine-containing dehydrogenase
MKRVGKKGEGKFERITWMRRSGPLRKNSSHRNGVRPGIAGHSFPAAPFYSEYLYRFLMVHGSPNYGHSGICAIQRAFGFAYTLGSFTAVTDFEHTDLIVIWGANPAFAVLRRER